jgi:ABC-type branched-subunit amino acid transport system ATPase component
VTLLAEDLHAGYVAGIDILRGLTVRARAGQLTLVIGANGVGKSTLLKCLIGQVRLHRGRVVYEGRDISGIGTDRLAAIRIAYIAQRRNVFAHLTVRENLEMGAWTFRRDRARVAAAIERALEEAPILARFDRRRAGELSGGQQRLLEIERAMLIDPKLLLVDEPTVGLDPKMADFIYEHLRKLCTEQQRTILMVDQNIMAGLDIADYVYVVELGANKLEGPQAEFMEKHGEAVADWLF